MLLYFVGATLVVPLAVLALLGSVIPIVGDVVFGGRAVLVTLLLGGWLPAVLVLAALLVPDLLEGHVYQRLIVGADPSAPPRRDPGPCSALVVPR